MIYVYADLNQYDICDHLTQTSAVYDDERMILLGTLDDHNYAYYVENYLDKKYDRETNTWSTVTIYYYAILDGNNVVTGVTKVYEQITQEGYILISSLDHNLIGKEYDGTTFHSIFDRLREILEKVSPIIVGATKTATIPASSQKATIDVTAEVGSPSAYLHTLEILSAVDGGDLEASVTATLNVAQKKMLLARSNMPVTNNIVVTYRINRQSI